MYTKPTFMGHAHAGWVQIQTQGTENDEHVRIKLILRCNKLTGATEAHAMQAMVYPRTRLRVVRMFVELGKMPLASAIATDECIASRARDHSAYAREAARVCHNVCCYPELLHREPTALCAMTNDESCPPDVRRHVEEEAHTTSTVHSMLKEQYTCSVSANAASDLRCRVCKGSDVSFQQKQTRGADEAMTIFCVCLCGARWKMS